MQVPQGFRDRYRRIAPKRFFEALATPLPKAIRVNTLKATVANFEARGRQNGWQLEQIPWQPSGFLIDRTDRGVPLGHSFEHFVGQFYIQGVSSQIPALVLDPQPGERVLDLAAAPGSKTTQLAAQIKNRGLLVANDISVQRLKSLTANLERVGVLNTVVTNLSGPRLGRLMPNYFDRVLLDAPCTSEGTSATNLEVLKRWSLNGIRKLATLQSKLLAGAYAALKPGGTLVYSTCTFAPEENESVISELLWNHPEATLEPIKLHGLSAVPGLETWESVSFGPQLKHTIRIWPGKERMEGFFVAKIRKPEDARDGGVLREFANRKFSEVTEPPGSWLAERFGMSKDWDDSLAWVGKDQEQWLTTPEAALFNHLPVIRRGLRTTRTVRGGFKPTTDFCQLFGARFTKHVVDVDKARMTAYLAGQDVPAEAEPGFVALRYDGVVFACGLAQPGKIKNQVRVSRRITG